MEKRLQSDLLKHVDMIVKAAARQRAAEDEVKRLKVELAALKSRAAIGQAARKDVSAEELGELLQTVVMSW